MDFSKVWVRYRGILIITLLIVSLILGYATGFLVGVNSRPIRRTILVDAAGTLQVPFNRVVNQILKQQYPGLSYNYMFEGSRLAANEITQANKSFDIFASADYRIIPEQLIPSHATWYVIFASNSMAVVYTKHSRYAAEINSANWYQIITSNKETDPSGSNAIFMLQLAGLTYYQNSSYIYDQLYVTKLANHELLLVPTETTLDAQLEAGAIDYELTYSSEAISHNYPYVSVGPRFDLSDITQAGWYSVVNTTINGKIVKGTPILYDLTIPKNSPDATMAIAFVKALFSPQGQQVLKESGFQPLNPVYIYNQNDVPSDIIQAMTQSGISIKETS
jgi:molybdate/tungstate transport system substrate-binding protein